MGGIFPIRATSPRFGDRRGQRRSCEFPAYSTALTGKGVHIVTVNDYLARRDAEVEWQGLMARWGWTTGVVVPQQPEDERAPALPRTDVTYATITSWASTTCAINIEVRC